LISRCFTLAADNEITLLQEMLIFYECPCNIEMITKMINSLPEDQQKELWATLITLRYHAPVQQKISYQPVIPVQGFYDQGAFNPATCTAA
jgi:hypothetical protein